MQFRIRRVTTVEQYEVALSATTPDVVPLWFDDCEGPWIARTIDPGLAQLPVGGECMVAMLAVQARDGDIVIASPGAEVLLAERYARVTKRQFTRLTTDPMSRCNPPAATSVTWFADCGDRDFARSLQSLCDVLTRDGGSVPPIGVLTCDNLRHLSWMIVKQLLPQSRSVEASQQTTFISQSSKASRPVCNVKYVSKEDSAQAVIAAFETAAGTLFVNTHSRPHCGLMPAADGVVGLCGIATGGTGAQCVDGTACHFGDGPRAVIDQLPARRVYFNGCTTAGTGTLRPGFLPSDSMIVHAALRGAVREFVGNVRSGLYGEWDIEVFIGASALGYSPAQCTGIVELARSLAARDVFRSCCYFGDALNPAWPVEAGIAAISVHEHSDHVTITWQRVTTVLAARIPGRKWAKWALEDMLNIKAACRLDARISIVPDPWCDASIIFVVPQSTCSQEVSRLDGQIDVVIARTPSPVNRLVGDELAAAVDHVRWLRHLPSFTGVLDGSVLALEKELLTIKRAASSRDNLSELPQLIHSLRREEYRIAHSLDRSILERLLQNSIKRWSWSAEYGDLMHARQRSTRASCQNCGAFAVDIEYNDYVIPDIQRVSRACGYCGIVSDMPNWPLRVDLLGSTICLSETAFEGTITVQNEEERPRHVSLGATVRDAGVFQEDSRSVSEVSLGAHEKHSWSFALNSLQPMRELMQSWVFVVSEGAIGLVGSTFLFGRLASGDCWNGIPINRTDRGYDRF